MTSFCFPENVFMLPSLQLHLFQLPSKVTYFGPWSGNGVNHTLTPFPVCTFPHRLPISTDPPFYGATEVPLARMYRAFMSLLVKSYPSLFILLMSCLS